MLHDLPAELIDLVAAYLDRTSLQVFRLTSRECHKSSLRHFALRASEQTFLMTHHRLRDLLCIANHKDLSPVVKTIRLATHYLCEESGFDHFAEQLTDAGTEDERLTIANSQEHLEQ